MILFKLKRDQARCIEQYFFPYMIEVAEMKMREAKTLSDDHYFNSKVIFTLINEVNKIFQRKLLSEANKFAFKLSDAQGITFYMFLMNQPIVPVEFYACALRQHVCDIMHKQIVQ